MCRPSGSVVCKMYAFESFDAWLLVFSMLSCSGAFGSFVWVFLSLAGVFMVPDISRSLLPISLNWVILIFLAACFN